MPVKNLQTWKSQLSKLWNNQDLSEDQYNYDLYYIDNPIRAWKQLQLIRQNKSPHFDDNGKSGIYKLKGHPTYPWLGDKSWSNNDTIYHLSKDQLFSPESIGASSLDKTMDYLGSDYKYNNGGTKIMYKDSYVLPTLYVLPNDAGFNLKPNKNNNGYVYSDR